MQENEETAPLLDDSQPVGETRSQPATTKVPEVEIHLFLSGRGMNPTDVFKWNLVGEEHDQFEVIPILEKYGLKTIFAFTVDEGGGFCVPIRFNPTNGRSLLTYGDGTVVHILAEPRPKNLVIECIQGIVFGAVFGVFVTLLNTSQVWLSPAWIKNKFSIENMNIPPWLALCILIVVTLVSKSSRYLFQKIWLLISRRS